MVGVKDATREEFEALLSRPPHAARMSEHAGYFVERLDKADKNALLSMAVERMWETRSQIHEAQDILKTWIKALEYAARRRAYWVQWFNVYEHRKISSSKLGKQS